jgi:two-component system, LytTR family, response regulator
MTRITGRREQKWRSLSVTIISMKELRVLIIDDEASSRSALRQKLENYCENVTVMTEAENGEEGLEAIEEHRPDIVFLDVEMPRMNGFVMLQHLRQRDFELIFTTAYDHYAVQAIRFSALDYLVKPVEVAELRSAVERARIKRTDPQTDKRIENLLYNISEAREIKSRIAVPAQDGLLFINISDIIYLEAESNYTFIYLIQEKRITVSRTLKDFEELLPASLFIRIHHSYIINKKAVQRYIKGEGGQVVMSNGRSLDVSRRKKEEFIRAMSQ